MRHDCTAFFCCCFCEELRKTIRDSRTESCCDNEAFIFWKRRQTKNGLGKVYVVPGNIRHVGSAWHGVGVRNLLATSLLGVKRSRKEGRVVHTNDPLIAVCMHRREVRCNTYVLVYLCNKLKLRRGETDLQEDTSRVNSTQSVPLRPLLTWYETTTPAIHGGWY